MLNEAAGEARTLIGADAAAVRLLEQDELVVRAAAGAAVEPLLGTASSSGQGLLGDVAQSRRLVAVPDVRAAPDAAAATRCSARACRRRWPSRSSAGAVACAGC